MYFFPITFWKYYVHQSSPKLVAYTVKRLFICRSQGNWNIHWLGLILLLVWAVIRKTLTAHRITISVNAFLWCTVESVSPVVRPPGSRAQSWCARGQGPATHTEGASNPGELLLCQCTRSWSRSVKHWLNKSSQKFLRKKLCAFNLQSLPLFFILRKALEI